MTTSTPTCSIGITAMGMVSSLGHSVVSSCAAARAGMVSSAELRVLDSRTQSVFGEETLDGPPKVFGHAIPNVAEGFSDVGKALMLGTAALRDLLRRWHFSPQELVRTGLFVNLSDWAIRDSSAKLYAEQSNEAFVAPSIGWKERTQSYTTRLADMTGFAISRQLQRVYYGGHAGIVQCVLDAIRMIETGIIDRCVIGGVDSLVEPGFLTAAATLGMLKMNESPTGLVPGEAAAFFLLERLSSSNGQKAVQVAQCSYQTGATETTASTSRAAMSALGMVIREVLPSEQIRSSRGVWLVGDLDGTEHRSVDWGNALLQIGAERRVEDITLWLPAAAFGSTGAASAAIATCIVTRAFDRGYAPCDLCTIWACSEQGPKSALLLCNPQS